MARIKTGAQTGKLDSNLTGIRIGDRLRHFSGDVARVDNYGSLLVVGGRKIKAASWEGAAWTIIADTDQPAASTEKVATPAVEDAEPTRLDIQYFTDADLHAELRKRGYSGKLKHTISVIEEVEL